MKDYRARVSKKKCLACGVCWLIVLALYIVDVLLNLQTISKWYLILTVIVAGVDIFWWRRYFAYEKTKKSDDAPGGAGRG